ncbi:hypothetical protein K439DRAFT_1313379, partial [Ramaria rubella]
STLGQLSRGGLSISDFNTMKQRLSPKEERVIVDYVVGEADHGFPPTLKAIEKKANAIMYERVGRNWMDRFLEQHQNKL